MSALAPSDAYRLWAPSYAAETAISFLDEELAAELSPSLAGKRLLDAGCGVGRRLDRPEAALAVGVDLSPEMLAAGRVADVAAADVCSLPFGDAEFDVLWCRLVLGHLRDPAPAYRELSRVCRPGGHLFVSDFHCEAVAAGHRRSFRDAAGTVRDVEHHVHDARAHEHAARLAGFVLDRQCDGAIGPSVESFYVDANRSAAYRKDRGLPVVAAFLFRRNA